MTVVQKQRKRRSAVGYFYVVHMNFTSFAHHLKFSNFFGIIPKKEISQKPLIVSTFEMNRNTSESWKRKIEDKWFKRHIFLQIKTISSFSHGTSYLNKLRNWKYNIVVFFYYTILKVRRIVHFTFVVRENKLINYSTCRINHNWLLYIVFCWFLDLIQT